MHAAIRPILRDGESDFVAVEEPLEIRAGGEAIAVTMRTPGRDADGQAVGGTYANSFRWQIPED